MRLLLLSLAIDHHMHKSTALRSAMKHRAFRCFDDVRVKRNRVVDDIKADCMSDRERTYAFTSSNIMCLCCTNSIPIEFSRRWFKNESRGGHTSKTKTRCVWNAIDCLRARIRFGDLNNHQVNECTNRSATAKNRKKKKYYSRSSLYDRNAAQPLPTTVSTLRANKSSNYDAVHQQRTFNRPTAKQQPKLPCLTSMYLSQCRTFVRRWLIAHQCSHWPHIAFTHPTSQIVDEKKTAMKTKWNARLLP